MKTKTVELVVEVEIEEAESEEELLDIVTDALDSFQIRCFVYPRPKREVDMVGWDLGK